jgi:hypothetical protein
VRTMYAREEGVPVDAPPTDPHLTY